jgi:predicted Zn-ribbon and HTH transcriptional regulator
MSDTKYVFERGIELLRLAQEGNKCAEELLIVEIRDRFMNKRISRYLHRNRLVDDEDLKQEFLVGVALAIPKARLDMGDPIEYLIHQGIYRVRSLLRKNIIQNTVQVCNACGYMTRLNMIDGQYICKRCGSTSIITQELRNDDETILENITFDPIEIDEIMGQDIIDRFERTLTPGTNVYSLYILLKSGINRDNPNIPNYIKEIAKIWGGCSEQNVVQNMEKLRKKVLQFAEDYGYEIIGNQFVIK